MKLFKTGEKSGKSKIKKYMALLIAGTILTGSISYAANIKPNFIFDLEKYCRSNDYSNQSGFCIDDEGNYYFARIRNSDSKVRMYKYDKDLNKKWTKDTLKGKRYGKTENINLGHANDMTYCSGDNCIYICSKPKEGAINKDDEVITMINKKGEVIDNLCYTKDDIKFGPSGIAYDRERKVFYLTHKVKGDTRDDDKYVVSVFELNKGTAKSICKNYDLRLTGLKNYVPQGITYNYNNKTLYVALWEADGTVDGVKYSGPNNSLVVPYEVTVKNGNYKFDKKNHIRLDQDNKKTKFEIEGICFVDKKNPNNTEKNTIYMAVNADAKKQYDNDGDAIYSYKY